MSSSLSPQVVVVGAGLAGIAAACQLADRGFSVHLLEKSCRLGGRAGSHTLSDGTAVPIGSHLTLGCCSSYLQLLDTLGTGHLVHMQRRLHIAVAHQGQSSALKAVALPHPWALAPSFIRYPFLSLRKKLAVAGALQVIARGANPLPGESFAAWLERYNQPMQARRFFWELITAPTLNAPAEMAAAELALLVFRLAVLGGPHTATLGFMPAAASDLLKPASEYLASRRGQLRLRTAVERIDYAPSCSEREGGPYFEVFLKSGEVLTAPAVIAAVPHTDLLELLPPAWRQMPAFADLSRLTRRPILDAFLTYDRPVLAEKVIAIPGLPALWVFPRPPKQGQQQIAVSISCPGELMESRAAHIAHWAHEQLGAACPIVRDARLVHTRVQKHRGATFSVAPEDQALRLPSTSPIPGLFLAGDWTATGWPATMEGAVRSGLAAASAVSLSGAPVSHAWHLSSFPRA